MNCDECAELLSEFIDERLPDETAAAVAAHLEECAKCLELETELRTTVSLLTGLDRQTPEIDIAAAVQARLERKLLIAEPAPQRARVRLTPWRFAGIGAAAAAVVLAALYIWMPPATNQITPPEAAESRESEAAHGVAPATAPQGDVSDLPPAPVLAPVAAKPAEVAAKRRTGGEGGRPAAGNSDNAYFDSSQRGAKSAPAPTTAAPAKGAYDRLDERAALREDRAETATTSVPAAAPSAERAEKSAAIRDAGGFKAGAATAPAVPAAQPTGELARAGSGGGLKPGSAGVAGGRLDTNASPELARKDAERLKSLGYVSDNEARAKSRAEVAQPPAAPATYGMYAAEEVQAKKAAAPAVATYYFEGKSSDVALQFLAFLPSGKKPLPAVASDLDALKAAAADRGVSIVEFSESKVALDYSVTPVDDAKIVAALDAKSGLMRQVVLSTVASVTDEKEMSQAEAPRSTELKKENPQLAAAKGESTMSNAQSPLKEQVTLGTEAGAVAAEKGAAKYRVIFLRKPVAPVAPATQAAPPAAPGS